MIALIVYLIKKMNDTLYLYKLIKLYGCIQELHLKYQGAIDTFTMLRDLANDIAHEHKIVEAYKLLGLALQAANRYEHALICFKTILMYAWHFKSRDWEQMAYNNISTQYFYLGDIKNLTMYSERTNRGIFESDHSSAKKFAK